MQTPSASSAPSTSHAHAAPITPNSPPDTQTTKIASDKNVDISLNTKTTVLNQRGQHKTFNLTELTIETSKGADTVHISKGPEGKLSAQINGQSYFLPAGNTPLTTLNINTHEGDDRVHIDPEVVARIKVYGGAGNDTVRLGGGLGYVEGNDGDDTLMGGRGSHVMYGGNGRDRLYGGDGPNTKTNYMDGGSDDDLMYGGSGHNVMNGGNGNDRISTAGRSVVYTGPGHDRVYSSANNTDEGVVYGKRSDQLQLPSGVKFIETVPNEAGAKTFRGIGSPEFSQRFRDDIQLYRSSPTGQKMLEGMDAYSERTGSHILIIEGEENRYSGYSTDPNYVPKNDGDSKGDIRNGVRAPGHKNNLVVYNRSDSDQTSDTPSAFLVPSTYLHHEISHAYNAITGSQLTGDTVVKNPDGTTFTELNAERQAVGLETDAEPFDFDNDPSTPPTTTNPYPFNENALREEMGLHPRKVYSA